jgi:hypothetical protein
MKIFISSSLLELFIILDKWEGVMENGFSENFLKKLDKMEK